MHDINNMSRGKPWPKTGATHHYAMLGIAYKGPAKSYKVPGRLAG